MNALEIFGIIFIIQLALISTIFILNIVFAITRFNSEKIKNKYVEELTKKIKTGNFDISSTNDKKDEENLKKFENQVEKMEDALKDLNNDSTSKEAFEKALEESKMELDKKD